MSLNSVLIKIDYSLLSTNLTKKISKIEKKNNGIYFTPPSCINNNINILRPYINNIYNVLEPSCGSCEYITALYKEFEHLKITGIELNNTIYNEILHLNNDRITLLNIDYLKYDNDIKYDLIIGNPPYFVVKKNSVDNKYYEYFEGRPNIFILFIIKSLSLLNTNGILSFILPKNFINCLYYDKTRKFICKNYQILNIIDCDDKYIETEQETIILLLQKKEIINNNLFILNINNFTIFGNPNKDNINKLRELYINSNSLYNLNFKISVGNIVWNQCKNILTDDDTKTRLIYSSDIVNNELIIKKYKNSEKKNYIKKIGINKPMIVINRGYGVGEYKWNFCLIDYKKEYLIENHLICIEYSYEDNLSYDELIEKYKKIILSLNDERTLNFINIYFGNNAVNTTELNYVLPIYQDI